MRPSKPALIQSWLAGLFGLLAAIAIGFTLLSSEAPSPAPALILRPHQPTTHNPKPPDAELPGPATAQPISSERDQAEQNSEAIPASISGVHGRLIDAKTKRAIGRGLVSLIPSNASCEVDELGRFSLPLAPGRHSCLIVRAPGYRRHEQEVVARVGFANALSIALEPCETGRILGEVEVLGLQQAHYTVILDRDRYVFPISQRIFVLEDVPVGQHFVGLAGRGEAANIPIVEVSVLVEAKTEHRINLRLPEQAEIEGEVCDSHGQRIPNAQLTVGRVIVPCDPEGRFKTGVTLAGPQRILASHPDFGSQDLGLFPLRAGPQAAPLRLELVPPGDASLELDFSAEASDSPLLVAIYFSTQDPKSAPPYRIRAAPPGPFLFRNLPAGEYLVLASAGRRRLQTRVELRPGESSSKPLALPKADEPSPRPPKTGE